MQKDLPDTMSVSDAVALILNLSYIPGRRNLFEFLGDFREVAESNRDHAKSYDERNKYVVQSAMYLHREGLARTLHAAIDTELDGIWKGEDSLIKIADGMFGSEKLVTASVCEWASQMGFGIQGWQPPRFWRKPSERHYHTEYLDILDDVIATFCEEGGEEFVLGVIPKKESVSMWIKNKYGQL